MAHNLNCAQCPKVARNSIWSKSRKKTAKNLEECHAMPSLNNDENVCEVKGFCQLIMFESYPNVQYVCMWVMSKVITILVKCTFKHIIKNETHTHTHSHTGYIICSTVENMFNEIRINGWVDKLQRYCTDDANGRKPFYENFSTLQWNSIWHQFYISKKWNNNLSIE